MTMRISPKYVFRFLVAVSGLLVVIHIAGQVSRLGFGHGQLHGLIPLFDVEEETNIPSFWSSCLWLFAGSSACFVAYQARRNARRDWIHWSGLTVIFYSFGMDEIIQFHERMGGFLVKLLRFEGIRPTGFVYYVWTIPALIFAIVIFFVYLRFLMALPRDVMRLMVVAGVVFVAGSVGFEFLEGPIDESGGYMNLLYTIYVTCEETLEMAGVCILILALLRYISVRSPNFHLSVGDAQPPAG